MNPYIGAGEVSLSVVPRQQKKFLRILSSRSTPELPSIHVPSSRYVQPANACTFLKEHCAGSRNFLCPVALREFNWRLYTRQRTKPQRHSAFRSHRQTQVRLRSPGKDCLKFAKWINKCGLRCLATVLAAFGIPASAVTVPRALSPIQEDDVPPRRVIIGKTEQSGHLTGKPLPKHGSTKQSAQQSSTARSAAEHDRSRR
jgi:hypothetical protein